MVRGNEGSPRPAHEEALRLFDRLLEGQAALDSKGAQRMEHKGRDREERWRREASA